MDIFAKIFKKKKEPPSSDEDIAVFKKNHKVESHQNKMIRPRSRDRSRSRERELVMVSGNRTPVLQIIKSSLNPEEKSN